MLCLREQNKSFRTKGISEDTAEKKFSDCFGKKLIKGRKNDEGKDTAVE